MRVGELTVLTVFSAMMGSCLGAGAREDAGLTCVAGSAQACVGASGCHGVQQCLPNNAAYAACDCTIWTQPADGGEQGDAGTGRDAGPRGDAGSASDAGADQPAGTVPVYFTVDDTANRVFAVGQLEWKGSFRLSGVADSQTIVADPSWAGPFPVLYDDGPRAAGGHEPADATAGDHRWGTTVFVTPPTSGTRTYEYGVVDKTVGAWIWRGANGAFMVNAGTALDRPITAPGLLLSAFGTVDVKIVVDISALATHPPRSGGGSVSWDTAVVTIKGSGWSWQAVAMHDDGLSGDAVAGDGLYSFVLSEHVGAGTALSHCGLARSGDEVEFAVHFGGEEYRDTSGTGLTEGVMAFIKNGAHFEAAHVTRGANGPVRVVVP